MTCQSSGRSPTMAMGLGAVLLVPSRIRMPRPPQNSTTFIVRPPRSHDFECGNREDQPSAPGADVVELLADLLAEVSARDQHVVRRGRGDPLRGVDRDV